MAAPGGGPAGAELFSLRSCSSWVFMGADESLVRSGPQFIESPAEPERA
jgi:hypothetical protein